MGYYTNFHMEILDKDNELIDPNSVNYNKFRDAFNAIFYGHIYDPESDTDYLEYFLDWYEAKWYEHDEDMRKFVEQFPEYKFVLEGRGEEREDWWVHWWEDGKLCGEGRGQIIEPDTPNYYSNKGW